MLYLHIVFSLGCKYGVAGKIVVCVCDTFWKVSHWALHGCINVILYMHISWVAKECISVNVGLTQSVNCNGFHKEFLIKFAQQLKIGCWNFWKTHPVVIGPVPLIPICVICGLLHHMLFKHVAFGLVPNCCAVDSKAKRISNVQCICILPNYYITVSVSKCNTTVR